MSDVSGKINNLWKKETQIYRIYLINRNKAISTKKESFFEIFSDASSGGRLERTHYFIVASVLYLMLLFELLWNWAAKTKASRWLNGSNFRKIGDYKNLDFSKIWKTNQKNTLAWQFWNSESVSLSIDCWGETGKYIELSNDLCERNLGIWL